MLTYILTTIIVVTLSAIIYIISKRLPQLSAIDLENMPDEQQNAIKEELIKKRLKRKISTNVDNFYTKYVLKSFEKIKSIIIKAIKKTVELEKHYKKQALDKKALSLTKKEKNSVYNSKLEEAKRFIEKDETSQAEDVYIEAISLEPNNTNGYLELAKLYVLKNDYEHAEETCNYIRKIDPKNIQSDVLLADIFIKQNKWQNAADIYRDLTKKDENNPKYWFEYATVLDKLQKSNEALEACQKAADLRPSDSKILDYLLEISIIKKKKFLALKTFDQLKDVNPENQKLDDFKKRIAEL